MGNILVVDDNPQNLRVIKAVLTDLGHKVRVATGGRLALRSVRASPPDLLLLDVNMPDLDGYQVCVELKADPGLRNIPVLFLSALAEPFNKVRAFEVGGVDYITKPFSAEEVGARVALQLRLQECRAVLERKNGELQAALADAEVQRNAREALVHMLVHDMRSPLCVLSANLELMGDGPLPPDDFAEILTDMRGSTERLQQMITGVVDLDQAEAS